MQVQKEQISFSANPGWLRAARKGLAELPKIDSPTDLLVIDSIKPVRTLKAKLINFFAGLQTMASSLLRQ